MRHIYFQRPDFRHSWSLLNQLDRLIDTPRVNSDVAASAAWAPSLDIIEHDDHFVILADVPGVPRDAIDITLENGLLTITGTRTAGNTGETTRLHRQERRTGAFNRTLRLPENADDNGIAAHCRDGVLEITVPKQAKPQPRRITINS